MDFSAARQILIDETLDDGIVYKTRHGQLPSESQMERILAALTLVVEATEGVDSIDRELAGSLFLLGFDVQGNLDKTLESRDISDQMVELGIVDMWDRIREVFFDDER